MHINNLLRGKSVPPTHSNFLDENSDESGWSPNPDINEFISHIANRDFAAALKIISGKTNVDTSVFLMPAFKHYPVEAQEFLDFWKSNLAPQTHSENIGTESFDDLEFSLNFNGHTYSADFEENPRVRLNELHLPKSPSFYKWFGDSKAVDDQGQPLVVYHATAGVDFDQPKGFSHFGTQLAAQQILPFSGTSFGNVSVSNMPQTYEKARMMPFYLKIESPLEVHDIDDKHNPIIWLYLMADAGIIDKRVPDDYHKAWGTGHYEEHEVQVQKQWEEVIGIMDDKGYDGYVYMNAHEDEGSWSWVPLRPTQMVSAIEAQGHVFEPDEGQEDLFNKPGDIIPSTGDRVDDFPYSSGQESGYKARRSDYHADEIDPDDPWYDEDEAEIHPAMFANYPKAHVSPSAVVRLPESAMTGLWGSGWYNPFTNAGVSEEHTFHIQLFQQYPEVFGWSAEDMQGKTENDLLGLYDPLLEDNWIRYYWAESTLTINGRKEALKKAQQDGFFKEMFSQRSLSFISFEVVDGDDARFQLPKEKKELARFLVTFTSTVYNDYTRVKEIEKWEDIKIFPGDEEIF